MLKPLQQSDARSWTVLLRVTWPKRTPPFRDFLFNNSFRPVLTSVHGEGGFIVKQTLNYIVLALSVLHQEIVKPVNERKCEQAERAS